MTQKTDSDVQIKALAKRLKVSRQSLYTWLAEGAPIDEGPEAVRAWLKVRRAKKTGKSAAARQRLAVAQADLAEAKAEAQRRKNQVAAGQLHEAAEVALAVAEAFTTVKAFADSVPDLVTADLPAEHRVQAGETVTDAMHLALRKLSTSEVLGGKLVEDLILLAADDIRARRAVSTPVPAAESNP